MDFLLKVETYEIIGVCMEVHNQLGTGFSEIVYKDALDYEFKKANLFYRRDKSIVLTTRELFYLINSTQIL